MPLYEFRCATCGHVFETRTPTMAVPQGLSCPECGSQELRRLVSSFFAQSARKERSAVPEACQECDGTRSPSCPFRQ